MLCTLGAIGLESYSLYFWNTWQCNLCLAVTVWTSLPGFLLFCPRLSLPFCHITLISHLFIQLPLITSWSSSLYIWPFSVSSPLVHFSVFATLLITYDLMFVFSVPQRYSGCPISWSAVWLALLHSPLPFDDRVNYLPAFPSLCVRMPFPTPALLLTLLLNKLVTCHYMHVNSPCVDAISTPALLLTTYLPLPALSILRVSALGLLLLVSLYPLAVLERPPPLYSQFLIFHLNKACYYS